MAEPPVHVFVGDRVCGGVGVVVGRWRAEVSAARHGG